MKSLPGPLVSVVTPVYNTADYLAECIESVLKQSYGNFEYVIVDNQSTDGSAEVARRYTEQNPRIRLIVADEHVGQVDNYNRALNHISVESKYCKMVQADDFLMPDCLERMVALAESDDDIALVSSYQLASDHVKGAGLPCSSIDDIEVVLPGSDVCRKYLLDGVYVFGTPTSVLYRSSDVRSDAGFFRKSGSHEDSERCFELLQTSKFGFIHQLLSFTRTDNDSLSTNVQDFQPDQLHRHIIVEKFGRSFLTEEEYREVSDMCRRRSRNVILRSYGSATGRASRDYYRAGLAEAGISISRTSVAWGLFIRFIRQIGNPLNAVQAAGSKIFQFFGSGRR